PISIPMDGGHSLPLHPCDSRESLWSSRIPLGLRRGEAYPAILVPAGARCPPLPLDLRLAHADHNPGGRVSVGSSKSRPLLSRALARHRRVPLLQGGP